MAWQVKYRSTFDNRSGVTQTVEFEKEGASAGVTTFDMAGTPLKGMGGRDGVMLIPPVAATIHTARVVSDETSMFDDIHSDASKWRMRIKEDGTETFLGPVMRAPGQKSRNDLNRSPLEISAMCGLGRLKSFKFYYEAQADDLLYEKKTVVGWLLWALNKIGLDYDLYTYARLYSNSMSAGDPLAQEYIRAESWWFGRGNWSRFTIYDLVTDLCTKYLGTLAQKDGAWHFYSRVGFGSDSFTRYLYAYDNSTGTGGSSGSYTTFVSGSQAGSLSGGDYYRADEYARIRWVYDHLPLGNLIPNGEISTSDGSDGLQGWTFGSANVTRSYMGQGQSFSRRDPAGRNAGVTTFANRTIRMPVARAASEAAAETALLLSSDYAQQDDATQLLSGAVSDLQMMARTFIEMTSAAIDDTSRAYLFVAYAKVTVQVGVTTYYLSYDSRENNLSDPGSWTTDSDDWCKFVVPGNEEVESIIHLPDIPGDGFLKVKLYGAYDTSQVAYTGPVYPATYMHWQSVSIYPVIDDDGTIQAATAHEVSVDGVAGEEYPEITVFTGTGPTEAHRGGTLTSGDILHDDWGIGASPGATGEGYEQVAAEDLLMQVRLPQEVIRVTYASGVKPSLIKAVKENSTPYLPVFWEYDYLREQTTVTAVEVSLDGFTPDYTAVTEDSVAVLTNLSGGGTALTTQRLNDFVGILSIQNALTVTTSSLSGTVTSIDVDEISNEQAVLQEGKYIVVAGINGGFQEFEIDSTPTAPITSISVTSTDMGDKFFPAGSGVHPSTGDLVSVQTQTRNAIYSSVTADQIAALTSDLSGAVTSLPVTATGVDLSDNWYLEVGPSSAVGFEGNVYEVQLNSDEASGSTALSIDSATVNANSGDSVRIKGITLASETVQTAQDILLKVTRTEVIDDINSVTQTGAVAISAGKVDITGTTTFYNGNTLAENVNAGTTTIDGDKITVSTITDAQIFDVDLAKVNGAGSLAAGDNLDDVTDGSTYARVLTTAISGGNIVLSEAVGDLDDIGDGTTYGRVLSTSLSSGEILMSAVNGDLDDIDDGGTYARVLSTQINAGYIKVLGSDATTTVIDGGAIQASSIKVGDIASGAITTDKLDAGAVTTAKLDANAVTAAKIDVGDLFGETITLTGSISSNNYSAGSAGWSIDGSSAEFNDVTIRGTLDGATGTFSGELSAATGSLGDLDISGTLTFGSGGEITNASGTITLDASGLEVSESGSVASVSSGVISVSNSGIGRYNSIAAGNILLIGPTTTAEVASEEIVMGVTADTAVLTRYGLTVADSNSGDEVAITSSTITIDGNTVWHAGNLTTQTVTGARDTPESALANLLSALASSGLITDSTTAT